MRFIPTHGSLNSNFNQEPPWPSHIVKRILSSVGILIVILGSLVAFPAWLHWVAAIWITTFVIASALGRPGWPWLVGLATVLIVKRPGWTSELLVFILVILGVAVFDWHSRQKQEQLPAPVKFLTDRKRAAIMAAILLLALISFQAVRRVKTNPSHSHVLDHRPIACLGDSLTDYGYPQELEKLISVPVADFGVNGIRTDDGIKMIPDILSRDPQLVVIELGGHDYNADKKTRSETKQNLALLIESFKQREIQVILVEIPRGFIYDPYDGLERELSAEYDLKLIDDSIIRNLIFNSPIVPPGMWLGKSRHLSDDGLHPNQQGNRYFAGKVARALADVYGDSILKSK